MKKTLSLLIILLTTTLTGICQKYEAETATLAGGATKQVSSAASGGYYVAQNAGNLTFNLNFTEEATYNIYIQVASPSGFKANNLVVDGSAITFTTELNKNYIKLKVVSFLKLTAGAHIVQIAQGFQQAFYRSRYQELDRAF